LCRLKVGDVLERHWSVRQEQADSSWLTPKMEGRMILRVTQNALLTQYRRHFQRGKEEMSLGKLRTSGNRFCDMLSWRFPVHPRWLSDVWKLMSVFSVVSWKFRVYLRCFSDVLIVEWLSDWPEMLCSLNLEDISKGGRKRWAWENSGPVGIDSVRCCPEGIECIRGAVLKVQSLSKMLYKYPENIECILCAVLKAQSLSEVLFRCSEGIGCIRCAVLKVLESI